MSEIPKPETEAAPPRPRVSQQAGGPEAEDNSLAAASEDATREIEKRKEGGGYGGFGDIG